MATFSILINCSPKGFFKAQTGLRQGGPISPFLFILCTKVLSRLLARSEARRKIEGLKISRENPQISHLLFVDDLIIFTKSKARSVQAINEVLEKYQAWSGQRINQSKFSIFITQNTSQATRRMLSVNMPYKESSSKIKYLGLLTTFGRSRKEDYKEMLEKINKHLEGWKSKMLSQAGRTMLIRTVVGAIPTYQMATHLIPKSICKKLDKSFKNF